ncbi:MAG TPA: TonB-dependent receptor [Candidatus Limnocylindria bacterium]|jgi:outer membrane receptor protein involved in Fe transport|nr:TonB-dependent receptor [Candidatus Limnocylindria bacterium]
MSFSYRFSAHRWVAQPSFVVFFASLISRAESANTPPTPSATNVVTTIEKVTVVGHLDEAREQIVPSLGASSYVFTPESIQTQAAGANASFNQVLLRAPGVAQDSFGQVHVRGEHANLQYRINDIELPEGISGFGQELDARFIDRVELLTGALPAQYGFRTAGVVDIHTQSGALKQGGAVALYGGSYDTIRPSFEYGGGTNKVSYYLTGSYLHTGLGIENPTSLAKPVHDDSDQYRLFGLVSDVIDDSRRISGLFGVSYADFEIPNNPGQSAGLDGAGNPWPLGSFQGDSARLNETQTEQNYYGALAYQQSAGQLDFQVAAFGRYSGTLFRPDPLGDLYFNGVASRVDRSIASGGVEADGKLDLAESHTLRGGATVTRQWSRSQSVTTVFPVDANGAATGLPFALDESGRKNGLLAGAYLQDEWRIGERFTLNFGGRFDWVSAYVDETQLSPRVNLVYAVTDKTKLHLGYARYFTPPPLELVQSGTVQKFDGTSNQAEIKQSGPVRSERSHYFDGGISQEIVKGLEVGVNGFYKLAKEQLDEGQFGQALIFSPFNYREGRIYGSDVNVTYKHGGFGSFLNFAYSVAQGRDIDSGQFQFGQSELDYISRNYVYLDHDQRFTGSGGLSYRWGKTTVFADGLYGSGLRYGFANTGRLPSYFTVNMGAQHDFSVGSGELSARVDLINLLDRVYELRDGSGIGVGAPQYGARFGVYGSVRYAF